MEDDSSSMRVPSVSSVAEAVFDEIESCGAGPCQMTDKQLSSLYFLFHRNLARALEIIDSGGVQCFIGRTSRRRVFLVQGKSASDHYIVFPQHYCSCHAFFYDVVCRSDAIQCKHQLAARLADLLKKCQTTEVDDAQLANFMIHC